jgi:hypothetical protein
LTKHTPPSRVDRVAATPATTTCARRRAVRRSLRTCVLTGSLLVALLAPSAAEASKRQSASAELLASGLEGASGSTIGPDGAIYVTEGAAGRITRVNPRTGTKTTFASGLPPAVIPIGGAIDVAFIGRTAYVLVTLVGPDVGGSSTVGIYRIDGPTSFTVVADVGAFSISNPPPYPIDVPSGLQFAMEPIRHGFLVTDGHHNRVLRATLDGHVSEVIAFGNTVPTGLARQGKKVFMGEAGPIPHAPENGKVQSFGLRSPNPHEIASGQSLIVDVEFGRGHKLFALSQGDSPGDVDPASPAAPDSGKLLRVNRDGTFTAIVGGINRPTSLEFIGDTAYVVALDGKLWKVRDAF